MAENLEFITQDAQGNEHVFTDDFLLKSMQEAGQPVVGVTEDGSSVKLPPPKAGAEPIDTPWSDVLKSRGYTVTGIKPVNADQDNVQLGWSAMMDHLTDDQEKKDFLGVKLRGIGHQDARIVGQGNDWYAYNPGTSQWIALTNKPGLDASDFVRVGLQAPRFLGSMVGATAGAALGAPTGPGAIASTAAGAGLGGGLGESLTRGGLSLYDKLTSDSGESDYGASVADNVGKHAKDMGINALWDAGTMGAFKAAGQAMPWLKSMSPLSTTTRAVGTAAEGAGSVASKVGGFVASAPIEAAPGMSGAQVAKSLVPDALTNFVPGVGQANSAGWLARTPRDLIRETPALARWIGKKVAGFAPETGAKIAHFGREIGRGAEEQGVQKVANWIGQGAHGAATGAGAKTTARSVLGQIGKMIDGVPTAAPTVGAEGMITEGLKRGTAAGPWQKGAEGLGRFVDAAGAAGQGLTTATSAVVKAAGGVTGVAGRGLQAIGAGSRRLGTLAQPMESYAYARLGTNELDKLLREKLRRKRLRATMEPETFLASQE